MNWNNLTDKQILTLGEPLWQNLQNGARTDNYQQFSRDLSNDMKAQVTEEELLRQRKASVPEVGNFKEQTDFIGLLRHDVGVTLLWKVYFDKKPGEYLGRMLLSSENERIKIFAAGVN